MASNGARACFPDQAGLVNRAAASGNPLARRCRYAYDRSTWLTRVTATLLLLVGTIHLTLIPAHLVEAPTTALLFALNGLAFTALALAALLWQYRRPAQRFCRDDSQQTKERERHSGVRSTRGV
ncbi:MAG TPA: hypothetical protein VIU62_24715 [Chloroflexota bacterium]